jgi:serine protease DegS
VATKQILSKVIDFLWLPVITGLAVASLLLIFLPDLRDFNGANHKDINSKSQWLGPVSYSNAVKKAAPSVVNIYTKTTVKRSNHFPLKHPFFKRLQKQQSERVQGSLGSGVIMDDIGFVVTNLHVVNNVDEILILLYDGREIPATVVGTDPETDLAILKIDAKGLQEISVGNPDQVEIGDVVLAIGNPFGMGQTVTQGIISATQRNGLKLNPLENYIQTDADINPGNSGGALIDARGNLLGINIAVLNNENSEGIGFAVPANEVQKVLTHIIDHGRVIRGWLGLEAAETIPAILNQQSLEHTTGLLVTNVVKDGPTHVAGVLRDDIVTSINGVPVTDIHRSINQITKIFPGQPIALVVKRGTEYIEITAIAGERQTSN